MGKLVLETIYASTCCVLASGLVACIDETELSQSFSGASGTYEMRPVALYHVSQTHPIYSDWRKERNFGAVLTTASLEDGPMELSETTVFPQYGFEGKGSYETPIGHEIGRTGRGEVPRVELVAPEPLLRLSLDEALVFGLLWGRYCEDDEGNEILCGKNIMDDCWYFFDEDQKAVLSRPGSHTIVVTPTGARANMRQLGVSDEVAHEGCTYEEVVPGEPMFMLEIELIPVGS